MRRSSIAPLLLDWEEHGLLSSEQRERILAYEREPGGGTRGRSWVLYGLLMLGGSVVGLGIISLIATNWEDLPDVAKLTGAFAVLAGLARAAYHFHDRGRRPLFDLFATLLAFGVLGTIGLISQVFHTGGELFQALGFWLLTIAPLAVACQRGLVPQLWVASSLSTVVALMFADSFWEQRGVHLGDETLWSLLFGTPLLATLASNLLSRLPRAESFARGYAGWAQAGALVFITTLDVAWSTGDFGPEHRWVVTAVEVLALLATGTLWIRRDVPVKGRVALTLLVAVASLGCLLFFRTPHHALDSTPRAFVGALFSVVSLLLFAAWFASQDSRKLFNVMTVLVGIRMLIVYLQVIGDLATTSVGLVVSGLLIIGAALAWFKTRARVEAFFGKLVRA